MKLSEEKRVIDRVQSHFVYHTHTPSCFVKAFVLKPIWQLSPNCPIEDRIWWPDGLVNLHWSSLLILHSCQHNRRTEWDIRTRQVTSSDQINVNKNQQTNVKNVKQNSNAQIIWCLDYYWTEIDLQRPRKGRATKQIRIACSRVHVNHSK